MKQVKAEIVDLEYEEAERWGEQEDDDDALMVARKIKQEFEANSPSPAPPPVHIIREHHQEVDRPSAPIVFDHFICMRIGLNSRNNVQRLMALLTAHEFVDLTVLPGPSMMPPPMPPMIPMSVPRLSSQQPSSRLLSACHQEASTSNGNPLEILSLEPRHRLLPQFPHFKMKRNMAKKLVPKPFIRPTIQSHVTTVHKAKSTKFDSSLAGPLSADDMKKMEEMITYCFPKLKMELQVTDRLIAKTMEVDLAGGK
uniref:Spt5-NGN domain-containing protein n=1 Tax=Caenorhabditis tropicalis TaxID=1561998 RepID=A0A1I7TZ43_9PELO